MKKRTGLRRRIALGTATLALFALLGGLLPLRAGAADYVVTPVTGGFTADVDGTPTTVYAISAAAGGSYTWTIKSATAGGNTYQDAGGAHYAPAGAAVTAVLTCAAVLLPTANDTAVTDSSGSTDMTWESLTYPSDSETDLTCSYTVGAAASDLTVAGTFVQADAAPVNNAATVSGQKYVLSDGIYVPGITVTFASSPYYSFAPILDSPYGSSSPFTLPKGLGSFPFSLALNTADYTFPSDLSTIVTSYTINGDELQSTAYAITASSGTLSGQVPADYLNADAAVTITLDASQITPVSSGSDDDDDDSGPAQPAIRVVNELDQTDIRSDTTLWPSGTTEQGGTSTTVVSDAELQALLDLAAKHAADTQALGGNGLKEGIFCIEDLSSASRNDTYILSLTDPQFERLAKADWDRLTVETPAGSFSIYPGTIQQTSELTLSGSGGVQVILKRLDDGGRPGLDATLSVNRSEVTVLDETYGVRIFLPYTPAEGEDVNALVIEYIHEDGTRELVTECSYDQELGGLVFFVGHLSKFGITYRPAAFSDVGPSQWSNPYVTFLVSRGILSGTASGKFQPDDPATRGAFLTVLTRALSASRLPSAATQTYSDVAAASALAKVSNWIYYNNLAGDLDSGGRLQPSAAITREEAALLMNNVARGMGLRVRSKGLDAAYTDSSQIADSAREAVGRLRAAGILDMPENQKFNPKAALNRGEMAQLVAMLLSNL